MPVSSGSDPQPLIPLEQLRKKALAQAERRGKNVAVRRKMGRIVWDVLWGKVLPSMGLFFCVALALHGLGLPLGSWLQGPTHPDPNQAVHLSEGALQPQVDAAKRPDQSRIENLK
jgi:hypothetical protein